MWHNLNSFISSRFVELNFGKRKGGKNFLNEWEERIAHFVKVGTILKIFFVGKLKFMHFCICMHTQNKKKQSNKTHFANTNFGIWRYFIFARKNETNPYTHKTTTLTYDAQCTQHFSWNAFVQCCIHIWHSMKCKSFNSWWCCYCCCVRATLPVYLICKLYMDVRVCCLLAYLLLLHFQKILQYDYFLATERDIFLAPN